MRFPIAKSGLRAPRRPTEIQPRPPSVPSAEGRADQDPPSSGGWRSAPSLAPPRPAPDDPRRRRRRLRATHMCGFLLKALVMSFTTRCTRTATSSLVSAMLAAAGRLGRAAGTAPRGRRELRGERARVRRFGGESRPRPGRRELPGQSSGGPGEGRAGARACWCVSNFLLLGFREDAADLLLRGYLRSLPYTFKFLVHSGPRAKWS